MLLDREFPPDIRVENEAYSLMNHGHEIHILSYNHGSKKSYENYNGIAIHRFTIPEQIAKKALGTILLFPFFKWIWMYHVLKILKKYSFDAVHIHDLPLCILIKKLKLSGYRVVADMHENYPSLVAEQGYMRLGMLRSILRLNKWDKVEKEWLEKANTVICVADEMKARLEQKLFNSDSLIVVPNTYNLTSFSKNQSEKPDLKERFASKFVVTYIGGFDRVRGIETLIEAISLLKGKILGLQLLLVGDGSISDELKALSQKRGIQDMVAFEGWQPSNYINAYIGISSVCIIPHNRTIQTDNSSPNKLFQYMFMKKPVITSNCTSLEKIVLQEECGLVFKEKDPVELAEKISYIYYHPDLAKNMGSRGNDAVIGKLNWDVTVERLVIMYNITSGNNLYVKQTLGIN